MKILISVISLFKVRITCIQIMRLNITTQSSFLDLNQKQNCVVHKRKLFVAKTFHNCCKSLRKYLWNILCETFPLTSRRIQGKPVPHIRTISKQVKTVNATSEIKRSRHTLVHKYSLTCDLSRWTFTEHEGGCV